MAGYGDPEGYHDETILPLVYELDKREEWTDPAAWAKANPALGSVKDKEQLAHKVYQAQHNPLLVKNLLCKDFNVRETATEAFLTFEQLNNEATFDLDALHPRYAIGGVDLSATTDLTCATVLFKVPEDDVNFYVHQCYWIPEDLLEKPVTRFAIFQSARQMYFAIRSEIPAAVRRCGAFEKISVSAYTQIGATEGTVFFTPSRVIAATVVTNPSPLAAVGTEMKGTL